MLGCGVSPLNSLLAAEGGTRTKRSNCKLEVDLYVVEET